MSAADVIREMLTRGNVVYEWPDDEAAAYRDNGGFSEGMNYVYAIRTQKILDAVRAEQEPLKRVWGIDNPLVNLPPMEIGSEDATAISVRQHAQRSTYVKTVTRLVSKWEDA